MKFLPTALANVQFAWKLLVYGESDKIDLESLDIPISFQDDMGKPFFVCDNKIFTSKSDLLLALHNNLTIAFGAAVITLNRSIEELGHKIPHGQFDSENDQCIAFVYQLRNAFAHDIAEPKWHIRNKAYEREYEFDGLKFNLVGLHDQHFRYEQIGGVDSLFKLNEFVQEKLTIAKYQADQGTS